MRAATAGRLKEFNNCSTTSVLLGSLCAKSAATCGGDPDFARQQSPAGPRRDRRASWPPSGRTSPLRPPERGESEAKYWRNGSAADVRERRARLARWCSARRVTPRLSAASSSRRRVAASPFTAPPPQSPRRRGHAATPGRCADKRGLLPPAASNTGGAQKCAPREPAVGVRAGDPVYDSAERSDRGIRPNRGAPRPRAWADLGRGRRSGRR